MKSFIYLKSGWTQVGGSSLRRPPLLFGDVSLIEQNVDLIKCAQSLTARPVKAYFLGPVTILNHCFLRNDQPRHQMCVQIAISLKQLVELFEDAGIKVMEIDETNLLGGLPLGTSDHSEYMEWLYKCFRTVAVGVRDTTQIHTHLCSGADLAMVQGFDADVTTLDWSAALMLINSSASKEKCSSDIGPGVFNSRTASVPEVSHLVNRLKQAMSVLDKKNIWVNPECDTGDLEKLREMLTNMVEAAKQLRLEYTPG